MLIPLLKELLQDHCEVVEVPLHNQWVYMIQKNGSSSLRLQKEKNNFVSFVNDEISKLDYIDIYIRNPQSRYISGVNTYLQHLQRDHPTLDFDTAFWFVKRYKFLNTHYLPQFYWIMNLSRYLRKDTKLRIRNFADFTRIIDINSRAKVIPPQEEFVRELLEDDSELELWLYLDQILLDLTGQELTWSEVIEHYQKNHKTLLENVLSKT